MRTAALNAILRELNASSSDIEAQHVSLAMASTRPLY